MAEQRSSGTSSGPKSSYTCSISIPPMDQTRRRITAPSGGELEAFSPTLAQKRELIAANKMDLAIDDEAVDLLRKSLKGKKIYPISGVSRVGVEKLLDVLWKMLQEIKAETPVAPH